MLTTGSALLISVLELRTACKKTEGRIFFDPHLVVPGVFFTREALFALVVFKMVDVNVSFEEEEEIRKSFNKVKLEV